MRRVEFKMERPDLLHVGDEVEVEESQLITLQGIMCYYTIIPALAMSRNIPYRDRLTNTKGTVVEIIPSGSAFFVFVEFESLDKIS